MYFLLISNVTFYVNQLCYTLVLLFEYVDFDFSLINAEKHLLKKNKK